MFFKKNSLLKAWISAARIRTLPLSVSGILIGSSYAYYSDKFIFSVFIIAVLTTISYQLLSNFANDYGDAIKNADKNRIGEQRMVQSGKIPKSHMRMAIVLFSVLSLSVGSYLVFSVFQEQIFKILIFDNTHPVYDLILS